ncbi:MAG: DUF2520 domain-containing protein [Proteobacteria bacterium]|nr:DUF2520 domain-containing protein [Pseudomonadota bacterium]
MKPSFTVVGCGKVGTVLCRELQNAGYVAAGLADVSAEALKSAAEQFRVENTSSDSGRVTRHADIVFITTPDGDIADTCRTIAEKNGFKKGAVVVHASGALPSTILSSARSSGVFLGSMHPLQSIASKDAVNAFQGITFSIEGEVAAREVMTQIADDLGATHLVIETAHKSLYHAAASIACNYLVTLEGAAFELMEETGIAPDDIFKVLGPLIYETLKNIENVGPVRALTGPIARGDVETVTRHLQEIESKKPKWFSMYKLLGLHTLDIATAGGTVSKRDAEALRKLLG